MTFNLHNYSTNYHMYNSGLKTHPLTGQRLIDYLSTRNRVPYYGRDVVNLARNYPPFIYQINLMKKLPVHDGCVNTICWNRTGEYLLSGSDDKNLCITKPTNMFDDSKGYTVRLKLPTRHLGNIFSAQFIPNSNDFLLVSCSSDGPVLVHDINTENPTQGILNFNCHSSTIYEVSTLPDEESVFFSCGEDKTLRIYDMRCHKSCSRSGTCPHPALVRNSHAMTTLSIHPLNSNLLLVGRTDGLGLVYDRRKLPDPRDFSRERAHAEYLADRGKTTKESQFKCMHPLDGVVSQFTVPDMEEKLRFTSLCFSENGKQVLASYSQDYIYLFNYDNSTDFQLIQTLPRKTENDTHTNNDGNHNDHGDENSDNSSHSTDSSRHQKPEGLRCRTPRIRVRGDWSDTGVSSTPDSARSQSSNRGSSILQRLTEVALGMRNRRAGGFVPATELVVGPLNLFQEDDGSRGNENHDDEDDNDDGDRGERDDDDEVDDSEDEEGDVSVYSETIKFNVKLEQSDRSSDQESLQNNDEEDMASENNDDSNNTFRSSTRVGQINPNIKAKFKNSFAGLKSRLGQIPKFKPRVKYQGHRNSRTSIKEATFWGDDYIISGSDCGRIMIWEKESAKLVMAFSADRRVVNCLAPNPTNYVLASSGIDYDIKLWSTQYVLDSPLRVSEDEIDSIIRNNELMLEEAKQTITVPPHLFFRVLASFAQNNSRYSDS